MRSLPDTQAETDGRGIAIDEVGISSLRQPVLFDDSDFQQSGIGEFEVTVGLPAERRGTHMSRMVQAVRGSFARVEPNEFPSALKGLAALLDVEDAAVMVYMPIATEVVAPTSGESGWQVHGLKLCGRINPHAVSLATTVTTDVTTLCPCSKAISDYGAHNQRSRVSLTAFGDGDTPYPLSASAMIRMIRSACSCPVFPVVKRPDERTITMLAYENPMFAEDLVRALSAMCRERAIAHRVDVKNLESIHSHDAIARLSWSASEPSPHY